MLMSGYKKKTSVIFSFHNKQKVMKYSEMEKDLCEWDYFLSIIFKIGSFEDVPRMDLRTLSFPKSCGNDPRALMIT